MDPSAALPPPAPVAALSRQWRVIGASVVRQCRVTDASQARRCDLASGKWRKCVGVTPCDGVNFGSSPHASFDVEGGAGMIVITARRPACVAAVKGSKR